MDRRRGGLCFAKFFYEFRRESIRVRGQIDERIKRAEAFGYSDVSGDSGKVYNGNYYFDRFRFLVEKGFSSVIYDLSLSEALYHVEEIFCENIRKGISDYLSLDKNFIPYYKDDESGVLYVFRDFYEDLDYSKALNDILKEVSKQYEIFKETR